MMLETVNRVTVEASATFSTFAALPDAVDFGSG